MDSDSGNYCRSLLFTGEEGFKEEKRILDSRKRIYIFYEMEI